MYIYPIDLDDYNRKYVVTAPLIFNIEYIIENFLSLAKIDPNRYAGQMFTNILIAFFGELEDIELIYENYYVKEYENLTEYMYKKMLMENDEIEHIFGKINENEKIYFADIEYTFDYNYENLFEYEDENLLMKINNVLEMIK